MPKAINCKKLVAFVLSSHSSSDHPHSPAHRSFSQMAAFTVVDKFITEIFQTHKKNTLSFMADHKRKGEKLLDKLIVPNQACS